MKNTQKFFAIGAIYTFVLSLSSLPAMAALDDAAGGPLEDLIEQNSVNETVANMALKVQNLSVLPGNKKAILMWDPIKTGDGTLITKYKISYGTQSVQEAMADEYEKHMSLEIDTDTMEKIGIAKASIPGLKNGEKYFFAVAAIDNGTTGALSSEQFTTPTAKTQSHNPTKDIDTELALSEGEALTLNTVKVEFNKDITLPEDKEERIKFFTINEKTDPLKLLTIEDVVFKTNYFLDDSAEKSEQVKKDTVAYIILTDSLKKDTDYQVTVSARLKDEDGKGITDGVTDNLFFSGTDATEIPASEKEAKEKTLTDIIPPEKNATTSLQKEENSKEEPLHSAPRDITPPEEITNLKAKIVKRIKDFVVNLSWTKSKNTAGDLVQQIFYTSADNGKTWGTPKKLNGEIQDYVFTGTPNKTYTVKITTKDRSGNESKGVIKTIQVPQLVSSGASLFFALGLALLGAGVQMIRRKREY